MAAERLPLSIDVVVVGSGAGGSSIAYRLALAGAKVLLLEAGDFLPSGVGKDNAIGGYLRAVYPNRRTPISCVGGQTKFYGAALYRLREADFKGREHDGEVSEDWPLRYEELEPFYEQAETLYRVHGSTISDTTDPPRNQQPPFPTIAYEGIVQTVVERLAQSGTATSPIPRAVDYRGGEGTCRLCATCDAHYCRVDGKMDAQIAALGPALASGNLTIATRTTCLNVLSTANGRQVIGVLAERGGDKATVLAGTVIVAAGFPRSAELLRRSRHGTHNEGLGNAGGALGRYVGGHSTGLFFPVVSRSALRPTNTKSFAINDYYHAGPDWPYPLGVIQTVGQMPLWSEVPSWTRGVVRFISNRTLTCCHMTEALPRRDSGFHFDGDTIADWTPPASSAATFKRLRRLAVGLFQKAGYRSLAPPLRPQFWHPVGGARMGHDPACSVVDSNLQVHGIQGLHVVDATVLPSAGAVNTSLTIMALALRCADHIARTR